MKTIFKSGLILLSILFCHSAYAQNQKFSKSSVKVGFGAGLSMGNNTDGFGFVYSIGYQREIWKDRLRFNPNFSIGHYSPYHGFLLQGRADYFNSINIAANLYLDLIRIKPVSLVFGCGGLVNNSIGVLITPSTYEYVSDFHYTGYLGLGIRINPPNKRTAINIMLFNLHMIYDNFLEFHAKIELDFKF